PPSRTDHLGVCAQKGIPPSSQPFRSSRSHFSSLFFLNQPGRNTRLCRVALRDATIKLLVLVKLASDLRASFAARFHCRTRHTPLRLASARHTPRPSYHD